MLRRLRYREAWRAAEALRSRRGNEGFPDWPDWCYVPAWYVEHHIVAEGRASFPLERAFDPMILSALCARGWGKEFIVSIPICCKSCGKRLLLEKFPVKFFCECFPFASRTVTDEPGSARVRTIWLSSSHETMKFTDFSDTARMRAPFFNGGLFDSITLTCIIEPSENRIETSAGFI
jgi:hypothetical protein